MKALFVVVVGFFIFSCSGEKMKKKVKEKVKGHTVLLEKVEKKGDEIVIPYTKYRLANGLTLIVHEDHSDPIVHVDVTYHVGSSREKINRSGFAHFFEHMMFQGSENVADEEHFKFLSEAGGTLNGTTNSDRTNYYETVPSNQLELALWLEADRMGFLLDAVTKKKFENQRETVKNERGQGIDNRPFGRIGETVARSLYPPNHGYAWPVIGWMKDLNAAKLEDLKHFFLRWYGPNNATLTVGGDVNTKEIVKLVEKYFASIERGPKVEMPKKPLVTLEKDRYVSFEDRVPYAMIQMVFPTIPLHHPDEAPLDLLSEILGAGKSSIIYKNLVKNQFSLFASVGHPCRELSGEFTLRAFANPRSGKTLANLEKIMRETILEFETQGVSEDDLLKAKAQSEARTINGLSSVQGKVSQLASNQTFTGNPNYIKKDLDRYNNVTKEDVERVYKRYIKGKHALILSVYQHGKPDQKAAEDNYEIPVPREKATTDYSNLKYKHPKDNFDRSKKPKAGKNPVVSVPEYWTNNFDNGIKAIGTLNDEIPTVFIQLNIRGGHHAESLKKSGLATLTASMMNEATKNYTNEGMSNELRKIASRITFFSGNNYTTLTVRTLTKNLDRTLELTKEKLFNPKFDKVDFERLKNQQIQAIMRNKRNASATASTVYNRLIYGDKHIMSKPSVGTLETVKGLTLSDVKSFYKKYYSPTVTNLVVVGSLSKEKILPKLTFLKEWKGKKVKFGSQPKPPKYDKTKIYFVNKDAAAQSELRVGKMSLAWDATGDYYKAGLMNFTLGGAFNSRINLNLREDKGYTYGARSFFSGGHKPGPYTALAGVRTNASDSALVEMIKEIKNYGKTGITVAELKFMKSSIGQRDARKYETARQKAGFLWKIIEYNLSKSFVKEQQKILKEISRDEIDKIIKKQLDFNKMLILVVGDEDSVVGKLKKLGYGNPIILDTDGNPIKEKK